MTVPLGNLLTTNVSPPEVPPGISVANHPLLRWNVTAPLGNLLTTNVYPPAVPPGISVANHPLLRWNV